MAQASCSNFPEAWVLPILSLPDRSTRFIFENVLTSEFGALLSMKIVKIQWLLVDTSFNGVSQIILLVSPTNNMFNISSMLAAFLILRFFKTNPSFLTKVLTLGKSSSSLYSSSVSNKRS